MNKLEAHDDLTGRTFRGVKWAYLSMGLMALLQLIIMSVLAHLLTPHEFGLVGIALIFINFADRFGELGVSHALIQREQLTPLHPKVGFSIALLMGLGISLSLLYGAPYIASFFHEPELEPVIQAVSLMIVIESFGVVSRSLLQRDLQLKQIAIADNLAYFLGNGLLAISLALMGYGTWSLVYGYLAGRLIKAALYWYAQPTVPSILVWSREGQELLSLGTGFSLVRLANYLALQGDNFVVGRMLGASSVGVYTRAYQLMTMPGKYFGDALDKALFPAMARTQSKNEKLKEIFIYSIESSAIVAVPATAFMWINANDIVQFLFGPQWVAVTPVLQILSLGVFFRSAYKSCDTLVRSLGRPYRHALRQAMYAVLVIVGAGFGSTWWGLEGVAAGVFLAVLLNYIIMSQFACSLLQFSIVGFLRAHLPILWQFVVMLIGLTCTSWLTHQWTDFSAVIVIINFFCALAIMFFALVIAPKPCKLSMAPWLRKKFETHAMMTKKKLGLSLNDILGRM